MVCGRAGSLVGMHEVALRACLTGLPLLRRVSDARLLRLRVKAPGLPPHQASSSQEDSGMWIISGQAWSGAAAESRQGVSGVLAFA